MVSQILSENLIPLWRLLPFVMRPLLCTLCFALLEFLDTDLILKLHLILTKSAPFVMKKFETAIFSLYPDYCHQSLDRLLTTKVASS